MGKVQAMIDGFDQPIPVLVGPGETVGTIRQKLAAKGYQLSSEPNALMRMADEEQAAAPAAPEQPQRGMRGPKTPDQQPSFSPELASTIGQVGLPLAASLLAPETGGLSLAALGLAGGLGGAAAARGGLPSMGDVAQTVAGEVMQPVARLGMRAARTMFPGAMTAGRLGLERGAGALRSGVSGAAERLGINLPATERFATSMLERLRGVVQPSSRFGVRQAEEITQAVPGVARQFGQLFTNPRTAAVDLRAGMRVAMQGMDPTARRAVVRAVRDKTGIALHAPVTSLLSKVMNDPGAVADAVELVEKSGRPMGLMRRAARVWWSGAIDDATKTLEPGVKSAATHAGGWIDGKVIADRLTKLSASDQRIFGQTAPEVQELLSVLSKTAPAEEAVAAKTAGGTVARAGTSEGALYRGIRAHPFRAALFAGGLASEAAGQLGLPHGRRVAEVLLPLAAMPRVLGAVMSSKMGVRWFAAGVDAMQRGVPDRVLVPALTRALAPVLREVAGYEMGGEEAQAATPPGAPPTPPPTLPPVVPGQRIPDTGMETQLPPNWRPGMRFGARMPARETPRTVPGVM